MFIVTMDALLYQVSACGIVCEILLRGHIYFLYGSNVLFSFKGIIMMGT